VPSLIQPASGQLLVEQTGVNHPGHAIGAQRSGHATERVERRKRAAVALLVAVLIVPQR